MENRFEAKDTLAKDLLKMLEKGSQHDVLIKLSDGVMNANKDILRARSDYFDTMFSNDNFVEGETNTVDMSHCSKAVMESIIRFLFSGIVTFEELSLAQCLELSYMSEMMLFDKLHDKVEDICVDKVCDARKDVHFFCELIQGLEFADKYNHSSIVGWIVSEIALYMKNILNDVESSDSFRTLPFHWMKDIVKYQIDDCIVMSNRSTFEIFESFGFWLSENEVTEDEKKEIADIVDVNFEDFSVEELLSSVRDSGLYPGSKIDNRVLEIVKKKVLNIKEKDLRIKEQDSKIKQLER